MDIQEYKSKLEEQITRRVDSLSTVKIKVPNPELWVIKIDGDTIILPSGKSSWRKIGHAKNALRNAYNPSSSAVNWREIQAIDWKMRRDVEEDVYQNFLRDRVEFVNLYETEVDTNE